MKRLLFVAGVCLAAATGSFAQSNELKYGINFSRTAKFVGVDAAGNAYVAGSLAGAESYGSFFLSTNGNNDVFVLKVDPTGTIVWAESFGGTDNDEVIDIDVDAAGNILIAGNFYGEVDFDPGVDDHTETASGDSDGYVLKLDTNGDFVWVSLISGPEAEVISSVATDASSKVYLSGYFTGEVDMDPTGSSFLVTATNSDAFFVKLNSDGSFGWAKTVGNSDFVNSLKVSVDFTGTPVFVGEFYSDLDINPGTATETLVRKGASNDIFLLKLSAADGSFVWGKSFSTDGSNTSIGAVHADGQNNIYIAGLFYGSGDFDPGIGETIIDATSADFSDAFIVKLNPSGSFLWAHGIGGEGDDWGNGVYSDGSNVWITGTFNTTVDFDPGTPIVLKEAVDQADIYLLKLDGNGAYKQVITLGDADYDQGFDVVGDGSGNIYLLGEVTNYDIDMDPSGCEKNIDFETEPSFLLKFGTGLPPCLGIVSQPQTVTTCKGDVVTFTVVASGLNLTYQWYSDDGEGAMVVEVEDNATTSGSKTATLTVNTANLPAGFSEPLQVEVYGDGSPSVRSDLVYLNIVGAPDAGPASRCGPGVLVLKIDDEIPGATYKWYTAATGGTPIPGATSETYTTPYLSTTTTYYVARNITSCEGPRTAVVATVANCKPIPELDWAISTAGNGRVADMHVDAATGTVYITGYYSGTGGDFDPGPAVVQVQGYGATDVYIAKYTTNGDLLWARGVGGTLQDDTNAITVDKDGNVIVAGYFIGTSDFDPAPGAGAVFNLTSAGSWDTFILKLDPDGNFIWAKRYGGVPTTGDISGVVKTDAAGNIFVGGYFTGSIDIDPGTPVLTIVAQGATDGVILKLDPNGNYMNHTVLRGPEFETFTDLVLDASGNIFATGYYYQNTDFDPGAGTLIEPGSSDVNLFIMKLDATGGHVWHRTFFHPGDRQDGLTIDLDTEGNVIVGGTYEGTIDFDPGPGEDIRTATNPNNYALKLDGNGDFVWVRTWALTSAIVSGYAAVDKTDVYIFGMYGGVVDMDPGPGVFNVTSSGGTNDAFVIKLDKLGDFQWGIGMGGASSEYLMTMAFDDEENFYAGGSMFGSASGDFDPGPNVYLLTTASGNGPLLKFGKPAPVLTITTQPASATACEGGTATFATAAIGAATIDYRWQKFDGSDFIDLSDDATYAGTATATLSVNTTGNVGAGKYRCQMSGGGLNATSEQVDLVIVTSIAAPTTTATKRCDPGVIIVNASGGTNGNYRWYTSATGTALTGEVNDSYTTSITATTTFYVSIVNGTCESPKASVIATVNTIPSAPTTTNVTRCAGTAVQLTASGSASGMYRWYGVATGGTPISTDDTYTTPTLAVGTVTYYVSAASAECESARTSLTVTVTNCTNNQPPAITTTTSSTGLQGSVSINLTPLLSDPDNNLDLTTLKIVVQPKSGAFASIDQNSQLHVDYAGISFAGIDELTVEVCDIAGSCVQQLITINVSGEVEVFNAVSPNGDGKNDEFHIANINLIQETQDNTVTIYNRWGDLVFEGRNYNNTTVVFSGKNNNGNDLPSGTYFYKIKYNNRPGIVTGYLSLKR